MNADEQAIRTLLSRWHQATAAGDVDTVLGLMTQDAVFLVAGQPPMRGRGSFESALRGLLGQHRIESTGEVQEIDVSGTLAVCWARFTVRVVPLAGGNTMVRSGNTLSIFRKQAGGAWLLARDANLMSEA